MVAVHNVQLKFEAPDRTATEVYWNSNTDFDGVVAETQNLIAARQTILAANAAISGYRISQRDLANQLAPLHNSRFFPVDVPGPANFGPVTDPLMIESGVQAGSIVCRKKTENNTRSEFFMA